MVEIFFRLVSEWSKWCAQTLHPFSQILTISSRIDAPIVAPPSDNFENCSFSEKGFSSAKKRCKQVLNRPTNADAIACGSNSTTHQSGRRPWRVIYKETRQKQLETKAMPLLRQCNTGRICVTLHIITLQQKKILPAYTHCSENHSITCAENKRFYI